MLDILIVLTEVGLIVAVLTSVIIAYLIGVRHGVDIIAQVELSEYEAGLEKVTADALDYVASRRDMARKRMQADDRIYQMWRRAHNLPDGTVARELFSDDVFRKQMEDQK